MFQRWITLAVLSSLGAAACSGGADGAEGSGEFPREPTAVVTSDVLQTALYSLPSATPVRGKNKILLEFSSPKGKRMGADLDVDMSTFMPAMGHGGSQQPKLASIEGNQYLFENVVLNMPGIWELHVGVSGEVNDEIVFEFDVD